MAGGEDYEIPDSGAIYTFGRSRFADNQPSHFFIRNDPVVDISCGDEYTGLVCKNGRVFVLGHNEYGQLGLGHTKTMTKPSCVKLLKAYHCTRVACGKTHTLVATKCNNVLSFGCNADGQLGLGDLNDRLVPHLVCFAELDGDVVAVAAGSVHSAALTDTGAVYFWGGNADGQCGFQVDQQLLSPTRLNVAEPVKSVSCGYYHSALLSSGDVFMFGEGDSGKLGLPGELKSYSSPQKLLLGFSVVKVKCGGNHTLVLTDNGEVYVFGSNFSGQLGLDTMDVECSTPARLTLPSKITDISAGESHSAFITEEGQLYTCGDGRHGKLCNELDVANASHPIRVTILDNHFCMQVSCGGCHTMVLAKLRFIDLDADIICPQPKTTLPPLKAMRKDSIDVETTTQKETNGETHVEQEKEFLVNGDDLLNGDEDSKSNTESNMNHDDDVRSEREVDDIYSEIQDVRAETHCDVTKPDQIEPSTEKDLVAQKRNKMKRLLNVFRKKNSRTGILLAHMNQVKNSPSSAVTEKVDNLETNKVGDQATSKACTII